MVRSPQCSCPHAQGLFALLGKKWVLFILRAIDEGATTFTEIRKNIGEANTKILTDRLSELVIEGILLKDAPESKYSLSPLGRELSQKMLDLAHWWGGKQEK